MADGSTPPRLGLNGTPEDLLRGWPDEAPIFMLHSGRGLGPRARWSILSSPQRYLTCDRPPSGADPLARLERGLAETAIGGGHSRSTPFRRGWMGFLSYDLGRRLEPSAVGRTPPRDDRGWPLYVLGWCEWALLLDHAERCWRVVGDAPAWVTSRSDHAKHDPTFEVGAFSSSLPPDDYVAAVGRAIEYIAAGDVFQANITQRLSAPFHGSTRALAIRALDRADAWYGAYLELPGGRTLLSLSPELFLKLDPETRIVTTRPIKGTRPASAPADQLEQSSKDEAELNMIVDLMRNDLGRVCEYGTVRVPAPRLIETHRTVHHGVAEVTGRLRHGVSRTDLLAATFPPGSVTGAPKIRAMQIIDDLEPVRRGPYCGAIGFFDDHGGMCLNVAIRTIMLSGERDGDGRPGRLTGTLDYGTGGGIVADSIPTDEYRESLDKAAVLHLATEQPVVRCP